MAETMSEIEKGALAFPVVEVIGHNTCLCTDRCRDCMQTQVRVAGQDPTAVNFTPTEKGGGIDQAIFDDLGVASAELPRVQRVQKGRVGED